MSFTSVVRALPEGTSVLTRIYCSRTGRYGGPHGVSFFFRPLNYLRAVTRLVI